MKQFKIRSDGLSGLIMFVIAVIIHPLGWFAAYNGLIVYLLSYLVPVPKRMGWF